MLLIEKVLYIYIAADKQNLESGGVSYRGRMRI
jgi:hypothetical protein